MRFPVNLTFPGLKSPSSRSFFLKERCTAPHHHLCGLLMEFLQQLHVSSVLECTELDSVRDALTTTLWTKLLRQFTVHLTVCSSSLYFLSLSMMISREMMSKALLKRRDNIHCSLPHLSGQSLHLTVLWRWSSITSAWWIHAVCSWFSLCSWKRIPEMLWSKINKRGLAPVRWHQPPSSAPVSEPHQDWDVQFLYVFPDLN